jgi:isopenicillin N synthase-like dioxygenase
MESQTSLKLPTIEFLMKKLQPGTSIWFSTREEVVKALEDYGSFIALNTEFSMEEHEAIFRSSKELFDLPTETKILNTSDTPTHGYVGQIPVVPLYEGLGIENATTLQGAQKFANIMWPSGNPNFCETTLSYSKTVAKLEQMVMKMVSESYGIEKYYESLSGSKTYLLKLIKYRGPTENERSLGIVPHTDKTLMSILHQHQVKGLEIKSKDGQWIPVDPIPSSFIVMAGDACMAWTNGRIEPSVHQVIMRGSEERYSLGLFSFIRDLTIQIPKELVDDEHPIQFKPFEHYKYLDFYHSKEGMKAHCPIRAYCGLTSI